MLLRRPKFNFTDEALVICGLCRRNDRRINQINQAQQMIDEQLEISNYVKTVLNVQSMIQTLFDKKQQTLLKY
jgi:hypothetical protein